MIYCTSDILSSRTTDKAVGGMVVQMKCTGSSVFVAEMLGRREMFTFTFMYTAGHESVGTTSHENHIPAELSCQRRGWGFLILICNPPMTVSKNNQRNHSRQLNVVKIKLYTKFHK